MAQKIPHNFGVIAILTEQGQKSVKKQIAPGYSNRQLGIVSIP
ncbi:MAG: hypothetical protein WCC87_07925 [Candidatus Korobacteraceae bacterium]